MKPDMLCSQLETTACPMCGSEHRHLLIEGQDLMHANEGVFHLVTCQTCGHIYQNPRPTLEGMARYYPDDYISFQKAIEDEPRWWRRLDRQYGLRRRCVTVHQAAGQTGRLLDVGCATGIFLNGMRQLGWQVQGVEPAPQASAYGRERFGLDIFGGTLEQAQFADQHFDVVTLWDVLEHLHEPQPALREIARILRPGGLLVLSLPNPDSLEARLLGNTWMGWDLPRHVNLFRPAQLKTQLPQFGLEIEKIRSFMHGYSVLVMSMEHRIKAAEPRKRLMMRGLRSWPMRLLAMPYYASVANWYNLSSTMVVFARRQSEGTDS